MSACRSLLEQRWTVAIGGLIGFLIAPVGQGLWAAALDVYDAHRPVAMISTASVVAREADAVMVEMTVRKLRDCTYIRMQAFGSSKGGALSDAYMRRIDRPEDGSTKPMGEFSIGTWRIWPVGGASSVIVYAQHDCGGRIVQTRLAQVAI